MNKQRLLDLAGIPLTENTQSALYQRAVDAVAQYIAMSNENDPENNGPTFGTDPETIRMYFQHMSDDVSDRIKDIASRKF